MGMPLYAVCDALKNRHCDFDCVGAGDVTVLAVQLLESCRRYDENILYIAGRGASLPEAPGSPPAVLRTEPEQCVELYNQVQELLVASLRHERDTQPYTMESLLLELLDRRDMLPSVLQKRCEALHIPMDKKHYLLTVDISMQQKQDLHIQESLSYRTGTPFYRYQHYYITLVSCERGENISRSTYPDLNAFLVEHNLYGAFSNGYSDMGKTAVAFGQCLQAIRLGMSIFGELHLWRFEDWLLSHLLDQCAEKEDLLDLCHPVTTWIHEYDQAHNTEYLLSLAAYILLEKSVQNSAKALHIHRNTMIHRVDKLKNYFKIDFDDSRMVTKLHVSIIAFCYLGIISTKHIQPI